MKTEDIKAGMKKKVKKPKPFNLLSTGSTLFNLICSGKAEGGFPEGGYIFLVGDSKSGKTWFSLTCMAEAMLSAQFKNHRFIYDNVERGAMMKLARYFGKGMANKLESPASDADGVPLCSAHIEEFYYNLDDALKDGRPFIYVLDSMDSLDSFADSDKFDEHKKAYEEGKDAKGSYGMNKAKINSTTIRTIPAKLAETGSILIIISQTRDNVDPRQPFQTKTRGGGRSLRFYATLEIWTSVAGQIKKTYRGKDRHIGSNIKLKVVKNRLTGKESEAVVPIFHSMGIDDIGSCIDFLLSEKVWNKKKASIVATGIGPELAMTKDKLIAHIEDNNLVEDLQDLVGDEWQKIEDAVAVKRKQKYE